MSFLDHFRDSSDSDVFNLFDAQMEESGFEYHENDCWYEGGRVIYGLVKHKKIKIDLESSSDGVEAVLNLTVFFRRNVFGKLVPDGFAYHGVTMGYAEGSKNKVVKSQLGLERVVKYLKHPPSD